MKIRLSIAALVALSSMSFAAGLELYEDIKTKQIFTEPGENRQKLGSFVQENNLAAMMAKEAKSVPVEAKVKKLEFSGTHYLGYTSANPKSGVTQSAGTPNNQSAGFEMRRNYLQVKGYFNDKDYFRVTLDATKELATGANKFPATKDVQTTTGSYDTSSQANGYAFAFIKYAYLWLNNIGLPNTGAEIGIAHRPWIDYEEHNGWYYRSINKVALEHKSTPTEHGPDLVNSADFGINLKSKFDYFTSEIGVFNGEGYHADKNAANQYEDNGMSAEWRLTYHPFGNGKKVGKYDKTKDTFAAISTYGLMSYNHKDNNMVESDSSEYDRSIYGIHGVYNMPMALIAGQYFIAKDDKVNSTADTEYAGYSINGEFRPVKDWTIIARYDAHTKEASNTNIKSEDATQFIYGVAYKYNKNVTFIANAKNITDDVKTSAEKDVYMLTAEVKW